MFYLKSDRLVLRNLNNNDLSFLMALRADPSAARYQRWEDSSRENIQSMIDEHRRDVLLSDKEIQRFMIALPDTTPLGTLVLFVTPKEGCITVGITLAAEHRRKGYAREILSLLNAKAAETYPALELVALIHPDNAPSICLFESVGFRFDLYAESIHSLVYILPLADPHA